MSNNISDVTVNISLESVVNPAAFGGMCIFNLADSPKGVLMPYTEVYSVDEANNVINSSGMKEVYETINFKTTGTGTGTATSTELNALATGVGLEFLASSYTVENNNKTINNVEYTRRIKAITEENGFNIHLGVNETVAVACIGSSDSKVTTLTIKDSDGNIVFTKDVDSGVGEYVSFTSSKTDTYTVCSTSVDGATMHLYGIEISSESVQARLMKAAVEIAFMQENPPKKIALLSCDYNSFPNYLNCDWRYLLPIGVNADNFKRLATYIEVNSEAKKVLACYFNTKDYNTITDVISSIKSYERTFVYIGLPALEDVHNDIDLNQITTALIAKTISKPVGSFTYKNQVLKGVYADEAITKAQLEEYHSNNINAYVHKAGYDVTSEGKLVNGEYIDILDSKDWLITQIEYQVQQVLINNDKIPYTNSGIALLENTVVNVLQDAYNNGMIAEDDSGNPSYTVTFARRSETKESDRAARRYVEGKFSFDLAGAIHTVTINGTINI